MKYTKTQLDNEVIPSLFDKIMEEMAFKHGENWIKFLKHKNEIQNNLEIFIHETIDYFCNCSVWDTESVNPEADRLNIFKYIQEEIRNNINEL